MAVERIRPDLGVVPETLLWTLYQRAIEARRPDARGRGLWLGALAPLVTAIPAIRIRLISVMLMRFGLG